MIFYTHIQDNKCSLKNLCCTHKSILHSRNLYFTPKMLTYSLTITTHLYCILLNVYWNKIEIKLDVYDQNKNDFIHTQTRIIYTINPKKLTLVGSVGPCRTNKVALKETYRTKGLITCINSMNCNLYHYLRNRCTINNPKKSNLQHNNSSPSRTNLTT